MRESTTLSPRTLPGGWRLVVGVAIAAALAVVLALTSIDPWMPNIGLFAGSADLYVYRDGGWRVAQGLPLYATPVLLGHLYTYPPFSALLFVPVMRVPGGIVDEVWMACNVAVLVACIVQCWRILGYRADRRMFLLSVLLALSSAFLEPVRTTLFYGQINLVLMLLVLSDFTRSRVRGVGVGIAAGIKLTPLFFVAYFAALRQWRAAVLAGATFAATVLVTWLVLPTDSRMFWTDKVFHSTRVAPVEHPANQSLRGLLAHLVHGEPPNWLWLLLALPATALGLCAAVVMFRRGEELLGIALAGLTSAAVSPFSWSHHWVWFVVLLVWLLDRAVRTPVWWLGVAAIYLPAGAWWFRWTPDWAVVGLFMGRPTWWYAQLLMNVYILVYAAILAVALYSLTRYPSAVATTSAASRGLPQRRSQPDQC